MAAHFQPELRLEKRVGRRDCRWRVVDGSRRADHVEWITSERKRWRMCGVEAGRPSD